MSWPKLRSLSMLGDAAYSVCGSPATCESSPVLDASTDRKLPRLWYRSIIFATSWARDLYREQVGTSKGTDWPSWSLILVEI